MSEHTYTRVLTSGSYNINNKDRTAGATITSEVKIALPAKDFKMCCEGTEAKFVFTDELTAGEITTLDGVVSDHKSNA